MREYGKLAASKKERDETGRFVFEGVTLCVEAFESDVPVETVLVTQDCLRHYEAELSPWLGRADWFEVADGVAAKLSAQKTPQGIFVVAGCLDKKLSAAAIYHSGRYLLLCDLQDAGNVGTMIRTAEAVGISGVLRTASACDPFSPKVIRGSMGAVFRMPMLTLENPADFLRELSERNVKSYAALLAPDAEPLGEVRFADPAVLLIGNEGNGLDAELSAACTNRVIIPMAGRAESLNAAVAAGILLWEMTKKGGESYGG